jgi:nitrite reductase/ring-hydroxylating ferredoxin subunit
MRGWWPVTTASALDAGEEAVLPVRIYGDDLVVWRGDSGEPHILDAYCRHLGAHLGYNGRVCGEDIRCFDHGWTWGPDGQNTDIPYDNRTHRGRRIQPHAAAESGGLVFLWYPDETAGEPDRAVPELAALTRGSFRTTEEVLANPQQLLELYVDPATAGLLLGARPVSTEHQQDRAGAFAVRHQFDSGVVLDVTITDVGVVTVAGPGWQMTVGISPVVDDAVAVHRAVFADESVDADVPASVRERLEAVVDRHVSIAHRMGGGAVPSVGAGSEAVAAFRAGRDQLRIGDGGVAHASATGTAEA